MTGPEVSPSEHPNPAVRKQLIVLVKAGWKLRKEGHWGRLYCPCDNGGCTTIPVSGTAQNPEQEVKRIKRIASRCPREPDDPRRSLAGRPRRDS